MSHKVGADIKPEVAAKKAELKVLDSALQILGKQSNLK